MWLIVYKKEGRVFKPFLSSYPHHFVGQSVCVHADCLEWLSQLPENSIHAIVTDPPYGIKEYEEDQLEKRANGVGGIWRIPPKFDNNVRAPLPRFTALNEKEKVAIAHFFTAWGRLVHNALTPGAHVFIATNSFIAQILYSALVDSGLEFRGQIIRLVRTLRGGDRPKNAEEQFPDVCSMPRGCYEPWGILRKPMPHGMKVSDCLKKYGTGGVRRISEGKPFEDVIQSERTPKKEREIANHPSLKPQSFLRALVYASLPLGKGIVVDPFMGSGSTVAAAEWVGYNAIGVERYGEYYNLAKTAIPRLKEVECSNGYGFALGSTRGFKQCSLP